MQDRAKEFREHNVHNLLAATKELINDEIFVHDETLLVAQRAINVFISHAEEKLKNAIPELIDLGICNNLSSQITSLNNELTAFINNNNKGHLNNVRSYIDQGVRSLQSILTVSNSPDELAYKYAYENLLKHHQSELSNFNKWLEDISEGQSEINTEIYNAKESLLVLTSEIDNAKGASADVINNFKENYGSFRSEQLSKIDSELRTTIDSFHQKFSLLLDKSKEELNTTKEVAGKIHADISSKNQEAANLLQHIANIGLTSNYTKIADREMKSANRLRYLAIGLMVIMIGIIGTTIFIQTQNGFDWKLSLFRLGAALMLTIPATYAAKESTKHRNLENKNRKLALELAALGPYLETLPKDKAYEIQAKLTDRFFGTVEEESSSDYIGNVEQIFDTLKSIKSKLDKN